MMKIEYEYVYKRSSKLVMKGSRKEPIEKARFEERFYMNQYSKVILLPINKKSKD